MSAAARSLSSSFWNSRTVLVIAAHHDRPRSCVGWSGLASSAARRPRRLRCPPGLRSPVVMMS
ncbi:MULTISPECIES: hypothetical protein [unclassified Streptomyces]|uniref:hypothetical protein n=1 Tax=unclassified Streptomyces TaxID=2593676 RepID=UPI00210880DD|nr:hypothetical protein [Streptomyces sp. DvalAA-14]